MTASAATLDLDGARRLLAQALGVDETQVDADARLGQLAAWDSLGHVSLVALIEERRGRALGAEELVSIREVADIARVLAS